MAKVVVGDNATGKVVNIYAPPRPPNEGVPPTYEWTEWVVPDNYVVSVGDVFDKRDPMVDAADLTQFKSITRHENLHRRMIRAFRRMGAAANTAADQEGLPQSVDIPDITEAEAKAFFKSQVT